MKAKDEWYENGWGGYKEESVGEMKMRKLKNPEKKNKQTNKNPYLVHHKYHSNCTGIWTRDRSRGKPARQRLSCRGIRFIFDNLQWTHYWNRLPLWLKFMSICRIRGSSCRYSRGEVSLVNIMPLWCVSFSLSFIIQLNASQVFLHKKIKTNLQKDILLFQSFHHSIFYNWWHL